jgi:thiaminase (transcriptional activator TenA)
VLSHIASKLNDTEHVLQFLKFAGDCIIIERAMHEKFLSGYPDKEATEKSPACFAYTNFLMATVAYKSIEEAVASILPCFWIYREVGDHIYEHADQSNPYRDWIDTYSAEEFRKATDTAIGITEELAAKTTENGRSKMMKAYNMSARLEYIFWESGYKKGNWSV